MAELGPGVQHFARRLRDRHLLRDHRQHHHPLRHPLQEEHADPAELLHRQPGHLRPAPLLHDYASHSMGSFKVGNITKCARSIGIFQIGLIEYEKEHCAAGEQRLQYFRP